MRSSKKLKPFEKPPIRTTPKNDRIVDQWLALLVKLPR